MAKLFDLLWELLHAGKTSKRFRNGNSSRFLYVDLDDHKHCWLILRCSKCDKKSIPMMVNGRVGPARTYCKCCGSKNYYVEKVNKIDRLDTIYAIYSLDLINARKEMVRTDNCQVNTCYAVR